MFIEFTAGTKRLIEYLGRGCVPHNDNYNVEDAFRDAPCPIQEHCQMVADAGGAQIAATIQSWTPVEQCDFKFIKIGAHPDTTEEWFNELKNSLIGTMSHLVKDLPVNPTHESLDVATAMPVIDETFDAEFEVSYT